MPGGAVLEIFEFQPQQPPGAIPWNRVGLTHISFNVRNLHALARLPAAARAWSASAGRSARRAATRSSSSRDFDGNLIEMMDLGYMYYVLQWLGPLGGWLFRRGMYRKYYE